jgi:hypothetical protein
MSRHCRELSKITPSVVATRDEKELTFHVSLFMIENTAA